MASRQDLLACLRSIAKIVDWHKAHGHHDGQGLRAADASLAEAVQNEERPCSGYPNSFLSAELETMNNTGAWKAFQKEKF